MYNWGNSYTVDPMKITDGDAFALKVVVVVHRFTNTWCCYRANPQASDEECADYGTEVDIEVAKHLFPTVFAKMELDGRVYKNF